MRESVAHFAALTHFWLILGSPEPGLPVVTRNWGFWLGTHSSTI